MATVLLRKSWVYKVLSDSWIPDFIWNKFLPISPSESNLDLPKQEVLVPVTKRSVSPKPLETAGGWVWNPVRVSRTTLGSLSAEVHRSVTSLCVDKNAGEGNYSQRVIESNGGGPLFFFTIILVLIYIHYRNPRFQYDISVQVYSELRSYLPWHHSLVHHSLSYFFSLFYFDAGGGACVHVCMCACVNLQSAYERKHLIFIFLSIVSHDTISHSIHLPAKASILFSFMT